jgi:hypothetical protein
VVDEQEEKGMSAYALEGAVKAVAPFLRAYILDYLGSKVVAGECHMGDTRLRLLFHRTQRDLGDPPLHLVARSLVVEAAGLHAEGLNP